MGEILNKRFQRTSLVYAILGGFLIGLFTVKYGFRTNTAAFILGILGLPLVLKKNLAAFLVLLLLGVNLGLWRGSAYDQQVKQYDQYFEQELTVYGQIIDDPYYNDRKATEFHIGDIQAESGQDLVGRVKVAVYGGSDLRRGDLIKVTGKMYEPWGNRQSEMSFSTFEVLGRQDSVIETLRQEYFAAVNSALPEPQSSLGLGFLVGLRTLLPEQLLDQLSTTGLTHIVAVSGYNLTILVKQTRRLLMRFSKFIATSSSIGLILGFLTVTGISPSIFRASIISGLALICWYYGRNIKPMMLILLGAAITSFISPTYMWLDLGWWLSFLAFFGVLTLAPLITEKLYSEPPGFIKQTIIETTSAQAFALPLIVLIFGELSLISILANVLILPLIPLAMMLTFVAGLVGMIAPSIVGWVAWPAKILLTYMTELINLMSRAPYALIEVDISTTTFIAIMILLLGIVGILYKKEVKQISGLHIIK